MLARSVVSLAAAAAAALVLPATSHALWDLAPDGHPRLTPQFFVGGEVRACPPGGGDCTKVTGEPGETAPGTTFELWGYGSPGEAPRFAERSPAWQGRVTVTAPPTISGKVAAGEHVQPGAATWTGGWGDDLSSPSLVACTTPEGARCVYLPEAQYCAVPCRATPAFGGLGSKGGPGALPPVLAGRYLIAIEARLPRDQRGWPMAGIAPWSIDTVFDLAAHWKPMARSTPVKIAPLAEPAASLRDRALRFKGQLRVGRITCPYACKVSLKVSGGGRKASTTTFTVTGAKALAVPIRRGKLTVRVHADGQLVANGKLAAR